MKPEWLAHVQALDNTSPDAWMADGKVLRSDEVSGGSVMKPRSIFSPWYSTAMGRTTNGPRNQARLVSKGSRFLLNVDSRTRDEAGRIAGLAYYGHVRMPGLPYGRKVPPETQVWNRIQSFLRSSPEAFRDVSPEQAQEAQQLLKKHFSRPSVRFLRASRPVQAAIVGAPLLVAGLGLGYALRRKPEQEKRGGLAEAFQAYASLPHMPWELLPQMTPMMAPVAQQAYGQTVGPVMKNVRGYFGSAVRPALHRSMGMPPPDVMRALQQPGVAKAPWWSFLRKLVRGPIRAKIGAELPKVLDGPDETVKKTTVHSIPVNIERPKGTIKMFPKGHTQFYKVDYGSTPLAKGVDGDPLDVFVGPSRKSKRVFILDKMKDKDRSRFDEHKVMLGFKSQAEARRAAEFHLWGTDGKIRETSVSALRKKLGGMAKEGLTRGRKEMLEGNLPPDVMSRLKAHEYGLRSHEVMRQGLETGSQEILQKAKARFHLVPPDMLQRWAARADDVGFRDLPRAMREILPGVVAEAGGGGATVGPLGPILEHFTGAKTHVVVQSAKSPRPADLWRQAATTRHEADEVRGLLDPKSWSNQPGNKSWTARLDPVPGREGWIAQRTGAHTDPSVILRESRYMVDAPISFQREMSQIRRSTGEAAALQQVGVDYSRKNPMTGTSGMLRQMRKSSPRPVWLGNGGLALGPRAEHWYRQPRAAFMEEVVLPRLTSKVEEMAATPGIGKQYELAARIGEPIGRGIRTVAEGLGRLGKYIPFLKKGALDKQAGIPRSIAIPGLLALVGGSGLAAEYRRRKKRLEHRVLAPVVPSALQSLLPKEAEDVVEGLAFLEAVR